MSVLDDEFYRGRGVEELIAEGEYESSKESILAGFKVFQKKYVYKTVAVQVIVVGLGFLTQLMTVISAPQGEDTSFAKILMLICVVLGVYFLFKPHNTYKKLSSSLEELSGVVYKAEIYTNKIIISTLYDPYISEEAEKEAAEDIDSSDDPEDDLPPATVIHIDNGAVEIVECSDMFVIYVKKVNVFVIPKSAFDEDTLSQIKKRLSNIMGIRYREN